MCQQLSFLYRKQVNRGTRKADRQQYHRKWDSWSKRKKENSLPITEHSQTQRQPENNQKKINHSLPRVSVCPRRKHVWQNCQETKYICKWLSGSRRFTTRCQTLSSVQSYIPHFLVQGIFHGQNKNNL